MRILKYICTAGQDFPTEIGETEESEIETNICMAQDIKPAFIKTQEISKY